MSEDPQACKFDVRSPYVDIAAEIFRMLSDPTRIRIILALRAGELSVNHIADIVEEMDPDAAADLAAGRNDGWVITRFPPEPNGYLHIGHAKSICLNFGSAQTYGGVCHMRFDDTNPEKEEQEYVDAIVDSVKWLGCSWENEGETNLYQASNYFDWMAQFAEYLISAGHAYVDSQSADEMRANRGTLTQPVSLVGTMFTCAAYLIHRCARSDTRCRRDTNR